MVDPLSITAGVLTVITVSTKVIILLKQFRDEVSGVDATLTGLLNDVSNLQKVLESMQETFEHDDIKSNLQGTGHPGNHWKNLARSLDDGAGTLRQLAKLLEAVDKTTSIIDGPRKQLRFKIAVDQIAVYREQIQSYRAALSLSLSTVILWNQVSFQRSTNKIPGKIIPTLDKLYDEFRSLGAALNAKIDKLQKAVSGQNDEEAHELASMSNLRECVRAAADVVSTASSAFTVDASDKNAIKHGSDFGDLFAQETNETMMRWMSSNTVYEYDRMSSLPDPPESTTGDAHTEYQTDSDSDLESDIFRALFDNAKKLMKEGELVGAERKLCNCLTRLNANASTYSPRSAAADDICRADLLDHLIEVYYLLGSWTKAKAMMMEKLSITERQVGKKDEFYLGDLLKLAEILRRNHEFVEAHLQGRRSLRGFKRLGKSGIEGYETSLIFLVQLCNDDNKLDEEEAYTDLLGSHRTATNAALLGSRRASTNATKQRRRRKNGYDTTLISSGTQGGVSTKTPPIPSDSARSPLPVSKKHSEGKLEVEEQRMSKRQSDDTVMMDSITPQTESRFRNLVEDEYHEMISTKLDAQAMFELEYADTRIKEKATSGRSGNSSDTITDGVTVSQIPVWGEPGRDKHEILEPEMPTSLSLLPTRDDSILSGSTLAGSQQHHGSGATIDVVQPDMAGDQPVQNVSLTLQFLDDTVVETPSHVAVPSLDRTSKLRGEKQLVASDRAEHHSQPSNKEEEEEEEGEAVPEAAQTPDIVFQTATRPSLVANSAAAVSWTSISPKPEEYGWLAMDQRMRRNVSDSRLLRNCAYSRNVANESSIVADKHQRVATPIDGELAPRTPDFESSISEAIEGSETTYNEMLLCPICNESLSGLFETSRSAHVNSCIDGVAIPISNLRTKDGLPPTPVTSAKSASDDFSDPPLGFWACMTCKPDYLQRLSNDICTSCGDRRATHFPSSINDFERQPFDRYQTLFTSLNLRILTASEGSVTSRKILLLGDPFCGKTQLASFGGHSKVTKFDATFNTFSKIVPREGHEVEVVCWDSVGMDYYGLYGQQFQRGAHKGVHMVLMCFDISEPDSLENVEDVWNPEANNHLWRIPKILVGCKKDLRNDVRRTMSVSPYKADKLAMRIGAIAYFETTAVGMTGLQELFNYIAEALVKRKSKKAGVFRRLISRGERRSSGVSDSGAEG